MLRENTNLVCFFLNIHDPLYNVIISIHFLYAFNKKGVLITDFRRQTIMTWHVSKMPTILQIKNFRSRKTVTDHLLIPPLHYNFQKMNEDHQTGDMKQHANNHIKHSYFRAEFYRYIMRDDKLL